MLLPRHILEDIKSLIFEYTTNDSELIQNARNKPLYQLSDEALQRLIVDPIIEKCAEAGIVCRTAQQK